MKLNLKKIYYPLMAVSFGLFASSCNDFLDREPISSITPAQYFNSADELGAYAINYYTSLIATNDAATRITARRRM